MESAQHLRDIRRHAITGVKSQGLPALLSAMMMGLWHPTLPAQSMADFTAVPPLLQTNATPRVMLLMSNDHQLFTKAYSDYSDLDGDGRLDGTYDDSIEYEGYFDGEWCYDYADGRFAPTVPTENGHQCIAAGADSYWSGNFLNWATMTRMDVVRRVYYGGKRVEDTAPVGDDAAETLLERALLPNDSHAFVKVYTGDDVANFTPVDGDAISLCNVTLDDTGGESKDSVAPPLVRVVEGSYPLWASTSALQCQYSDKIKSDDAFDDNFSPASADGDDLIVRVQACVEDLDAATSDHCRHYGGDASIAKPAGLLQESGEDGSIEFGLMTGSYSQKIEGSILRRNIMALAGNVNDADDEIVLATGQFSYLVAGRGFSGGIIQALDSLRITGWDYGDGEYPDCSVDLAAYKLPLGLWAQETVDLPADTLDVNDFKVPGKCQDWGNPLAEMYMEALRYFADNANGATAAFSDNNDGGLISGLTKETWVDPLADAEPCAQCAIIVMSSGANSFDADDLGVGSGLPGFDESALSARTDAIGDDAGLSGASVLVGNTDGNSDVNTCSAKSITLLSDVLGICVEVPSLEGSYQLAGLASWAQTSDLRSGDGMEGVQNVDTYSVALADTLSSFSFETSDGSAITIVPTCQSSLRDAASWSDCSIVDARIVDQRTVTSGVGDAAVEKTVYTRIDIVWEGALWGGNYGMDGISTIEICSAETGAIAACAYVGPLVNNTDFAYYTNAVEWSDDSAADQLQVRTSVPQVWSDYDLRFGFIVAGSQGDDGSYALTNGIREPFTSAWTDDYSCFPADFYAGGNVAVARRDSCQAQMIWGDAMALTASAVAVDRIEDPLWYAAKYGNFDDSDAQTLPAETSDWDAVDLAGNSGGDGIPDAYFPVGNLSQLSARLTRVVEVIHRQAASGTSVAVTLERRDGVGATFQAYYYPSYKELGTNREVGWVGGLHALFLDGDLHLREDSDQNGVLSEADSRIRVLFDGTDTVVERYASLTDYEAGNVLETVSFSELESIWDAKDRLAELSDEQVEAQRNYTDAQGRYIFTWLDQVDAESGERDGTVDTGEIIAFVPSNFDELAEFGLLGQTDADAAADLINFVRGSGSVAGARSRNVTLPGSGVLGEWRLGDIVHSSPLIVGRPNDGFDIDYRDPTYTVFRDKYLERRQVVYAGANDGMLHAFNAGFYSAGEATFSTAGIHPVTGETVTPYALGTELWAYVPRNLLPHLRWLQDPAYDHVFYVDGEPRAYDVNIFTPSDTHPEGWGTILVVGFRFGGGDISVALNADGDDIYTARSAYVILDITDPEQAPTVLAEITDPNLGYTTGVPALMNGRQADSLTGVYNSGEDAWYLVFGSGPNGLTAGVSDQNARLYLYDLKTLAYHDWDSSNDGVQAGLDLGRANSFVGDPMSVDWDKDYLDNAVYFGLVTGTAGQTPTGSLERLTLNWSTAVGTAPTLNTITTATMLNPGLPFMGAPTLFRDRVERRSWVLAGTGRFLTAADNADDGNNNKFFGLLEPLADDGSLSYATISPDNLADTTDVRVLSDESVYDAETETDGATLTVAGSSFAVADFDDLLDATETAGGWYNDLSALEGLSARNYNGSIPINSGVGFVRFAPDEEVCAPAGYSQLSFRDARTGTASRNIFLSLEAVPATVTKVGDAELLNGDSDVRDGAVSRLTQVRTKDGISVGSSNNYGGIQFDQVLSLSGSGKGDDSYVTGRQGWREIPIQRN